MLIRLLISQKGCMIIKLSILRKYEVLVMYKGRLLNIQPITVGSLVNYFNHDDFIWVGLGGMGYSCRLYKKTISNCKFIRSWFQTGIFKKKKHFTSSNFSNFYMDSKILKISNFSKFFNVCWNLCVIPISYTCLHEISYKCKYVLFHLNMLRLFQEINMLFFLWD